MHYNDALYYSIAFGQIQYEAGGNPCPPGIFGKGSGFYRKLRDKNNDGFNESIRLLRVRVEQAMETQENIGCVFTGVRKWRHGEGLQWGRTAKSEPPCIDFSCKQS